MPRREFIGETESDYICRANLLDFSPENPRKNSDPKYASIKQKDLHNVRFFLVRCAPTQVLKLTFTGHHELEAIRE
jgi:hypothetical protein